MTKEYPTRFAQILDKKGITLPNLARQTGYLYRTLLNYYRGNRKPPIDVAVDIARFVDEPFEEVWELGEELKREPIATT